MICYFADRDMTITGVASTNLPNGYRIVDDTKTDEIATGVKTFELTIGVDRWNADARKSFKALNYIFRNAEASVLDESGETVSTTECELYVIMNVEVDISKHRVNIEAEDAGLDLINEVAEIYEASQGYTIAEYFDIFTGGDSGFAYDLTELTPDQQQRKLKLSWDGETTVAERLISIVHSFGHELYYTFDISNANFVVNKKYIKVVPSRGADNYAILNVGIDIDDIIITESGENVATSMHALGATVNPSNGWESPTWPGTYVWIKFASTAEGEEMSDGWNDPKEGWKGYIGLTHRRVDQNKSSTASDYTWAPITQGWAPDNTQSNKYFWFAWSQTSDGRGMTNQAGAGYYYMWIGLDKGSRWPTLRPTDYQLRIPNPVSNEGFVLSLVGYVYDDGDIYCTVNSGMLTSRQSLEKWSRYISTDNTDKERNIMRTFTYQTINQAELCNRAVADLRARKDTVTTYSVSILRLEGIQVGDTVRIVDTTNGILLQARLTKLETSIVNNTIKGTFEDFVDLT